MTGGSGFIGSHTILQLLAAGYQVRTAVRNLRREPDVHALLKERGAATGDRVSFFRADLEADAGWPEAVSACEYVLHVASPFPPTLPRKAGDAGRPVHRRQAGVPPDALDSGAIMQRGG